MTNVSMDTVTYTSVRANLARAMDRVCDGRKPLRITRDEGQAVVLLSLKDYESLAETAYLLRTPANAGRLLAAIDQLKTSAGINHQVNIVSANPAGHLKLRIRFDDGAEQIVDFKPFLQRSLHPDIRSFLDAGKFAGYRIANGELAWGDYELCFPIMDLYNNQIDKQALMSAA